MPPRCPRLEQIEIRRLGVAEVNEQLDGLAGVLADCVAGGASVSYMAPFSHEQARERVRSRSPPRSSRAAGCFWPPSPTASWSARCR